MRTVIMTAGGRAAALVLVATLLGGCVLQRDPMQRGARMLAAGDYAGARDAFSAAIAAGQDLAVAYANRCYANQALGDYEQAVEDCSQALRLDPDGPEAHQVLNNRGVAYLELLKYDQAIADFDRAIRLQPEYAEAYANRGAANARREDFEAALADLDHVIELAESGADVSREVLSQAYGNRGYVHESRGEVVEAMRDYGRSIEVMDNAQARFSRATIWFHNVCMDQAIEDYQRVVDLSPPNDYMRFQAQERLNFFQHMTDETRRNQDCTLADEVAGEDGGSKPKG